MNYSTEKLLSRLAKLRSAGDGKWIACCPAHNDKSPSLSIKALPDKILIHCHAGCGGQAVLDAVNLEWGDLYPDKWVAGRHATYAAYEPPPITPIQLKEMDEVVIRLAGKALAAGETLSLEDHARYELAIERLEAQQK